MEQEKTKTNSFEEKTDYIKMDWSIESPQERIELVEKIIANTPPERLTSLYLDKMAEYIIKPDTIKERREERQILTNNRMKVLNERETSFEGLVGKMEKGEDGIYNIITNDKNVILSPKKKITEKDIETIPELKLLVDAIEVVEEQSKRARGKKAFLLKKQLIEMHKDQYEIKKSYKKPIYCTNLIKSFSKLNLDEEITISIADLLGHDGTLIIFQQYYVIILI